MQLDKKAKVKARLRLPVSGMFDGRIRPALTIGDYAWMDKHPGDEHAWIIGAQVVLSGLEQFDIGDETYEGICERTKAGMLYTCIHQNPIRLKSHRFQGESMFEIAWDDLAEEQFNDVVQPDSSPCLYPDVAPEFSIGDIVRHKVDTENLLVVRGIQFIPPVLRAELGRFSAPSFLSGSGYYYHYFGYVHPGGLCDDSGIYAEDTLELVPVSELRG